MLHASGRHESGLVISPLPPQAFYGFGIDFFSPRLVLPLPPTVGAFGAPRNSNQSSDSGRRSGPIASMPKFLLSQLVTKVFAC
jgi:hypothetical protein